MRLPDPIANTTTEAYLAYKAGVLEESELKPKLYYPTDHFDAWLAYWAGLTDTYPVKGVGKNLCNGISEGYWVNTVATIAGKSGNDTGLAIKVKKNTDYSVSTTETQTRYRTTFVRTLPTSNTGVSGGSGVARDGQNTSFFRNSRDFDYLIVNATDLSKIQVEEGRTATAYEPYTGEPEMLCDEEALVAYLAGVTNTYPDSVKDPYDVRIAGYLRYLVSARFGRPEYPVNNEELYLSMLKPPIVTNETPSSDITLEGTCEAPFVDAKIYGDTKQNSYTGKNLFDCRLRDSANGLMFEWVEGGIIHMYGTPTAEWVAVTPNWDGGANISVIPEGTTLSFGSRITGTGLLSLALRVRNSNAPNDRTDDIGTGTRTKTTTKENNFMMLWSHHTVGTLVDAYIQCQVTASDAADDDFEPYTGAIPSPSEFFPQEIETVTGHQSVRVIGSRNIFDKNKYLGMTVYVDSNNRIVYSLGANSVFVRCKPNTKYTVSKTADGAQPRFCVFTTTSLPEPAMIISQLVGTRIGADTNTSYTITTGEEDEWLGVFLRVTSTEKTLEEILDTLQIEEGEVATEYSEYSGREYEINLGKNIADMSTYNYGNILADGTITDSTDFCRSNMFRVEEGAQYTIWVDLENEPSDRAIRIAFYDGHKQFLRRWSLTPNPVGSAVTVGAPEEASYIVIAFCIRDGGMHKAQIEAGDTFTGYADYFEPIKLGELEGKSDYIFRDADGNWKIHRETYAGVLDGSEDENWYVSSGAFKCNNLTQAASASIPALGWPDMSADYYSYNVPSSTHGIMGEAYCSGFIPTKSYEVVAGRGDSHFGLAAIDTKGGNSSIYIGSIQGVTIAQFMEYLAADPIEVRYVLKTPYDEEITNQALIAQLDAFMNGGSDDGQTDIEVSAPYPELMAKLKIEAGEYR